MSTQASYSMPAKVNRGLHTQSGRIALLARSSADASLVLNEPNCRNCTNDNVSYHHYMRVNARKHTLLPRILQRWTGRLSTAALCILR
jgi:hypothetical protein